MNPGLAVFFVPVQADTKLEVFKVKCREMRMSL